MTDLILGGSSYGFVLLSLLGNTIMRKGQKKVFKYSLGHSNKKVFFMILKNLFGWLLQQTLIPTCCLDTNLQQEIFHLQLKHMQIPITVDLN